MNIALTRKSRNSKVGPIPVTTSAKETCPPSCPLKDSGCYAEAGFYTRMYWNKVTDGTRGTGYDTFLEQIRKLPAGQTWRHNVAGDLVGKSDAIDRQALYQLIGANQGKRGFTYTHYPVTDKSNREGILDANNNGFTVNFSANTPAEALDIKKAYKLPVVTVVPSDYWAEGNKKGDIARCPAEYKDTNCAECQLCARPDRAVIVGFTAHGTQAKQADLIARG